MKLSQINLIVVISLVSLIGCVKEENGAKTSSSKKKTELKSDNIKKVKKEEALKICDLKSKKLNLALIRNEIGDTISIKKTLQFLGNSSTNFYDEDIKRIIKREAKLFLISDKQNYVTIGFLEDEGEYLSIHIYSIDKQNCKVLSKELIAETTAWEHGYKETYSIFENDLKLKRIKSTGGKDFGDYKTWKRDTTRTKIILEESGKIFSEKI